VIIITDADYPKTKNIKANLRGCSTKELKNTGKQLFHMMMGSTYKKCGGYSIEFDAIAIEEELRWRESHVEG
jgi:hypothetical protein